MKKLLCIACAVALIFLSCGCSAKEAIEDDRQEYMISALGFDMDNNVCRVSAEALIVNSDNQKGGVDKKVLIGEGDNIQTAFSQISTQITQPLGFGHCGVVAFGKEVGLEKTREILNFCTKKNEINLAAICVYTENARQLLELKPISSVTVGYDVMSMTEVVSVQWGAELQNRVYELLSALREPIEVIWLPVLKTENDTFSVDGMAVLGTDKYLLTKEEVCLSAFITDRVSSGKILIDNKMLDMKYSSTSYQFSLKKRLNITINIRFKGTGNREALKKNLLGFLNNRRTDIWGLGNVIAQKEPKLWGKLKSNYESAFNSARFEVNLYE